MSEIEGKITIDIPHYRILIGECWYNVGEVKLEFDAKEILGYIVGNMTEFFMENEYFSITAKCDGIQEDVMLNTVGSKMIWLLRHYINYHLTIDHDE